MNRLPLSKTDLDQRSGDLAAHHDIVERDHRTDAAQIDRHRAALDRARDDGGGLRRARLSLLLRGSRLVPDDKGAQGGGGQQRDDNGWSGANHAAKPGERGRSATACSDCSGNVGRVASALPLAAGGVRNGDDLAFPGRAELGSPERWARSAWRLQHRSRVGAAQARCRRRSGRAGCAGRTASGAVGHPAAIERSTGGGTRRGQRTQSRLSDLSGAERDIAAGIAGRCEARDAQRGRRSHAGGRIGLRISSCAAAYPDHHSQGESASHRCVSSTRSQAHCPRSASSSPAARCVATASATIRHRRRFPPAPVIAVVRNCRIGEHLTALF